MLHCLYVFKLKVKSNPLVLRGYHTYEHNEVIKS